jgi:hypothetical protein
MLMIEALRLDRHRPCIPAPFFNRMTPLHNLMRTSVSNGLGKKMRFRPLIPLMGLFALGSLGAAVSAAAQSPTFTVSQNGKPVGTASFTFTSKPSGIDSTSLVRVNMQGLTYNLSKTEELSPARRLLHVQLSAIVNNSAVNIVAKPDGAQFLMNISANGHAGTTRLDAHKSAVFLPDFDPGALQTLLTLAAASNNRDLWAVIPKQTGSISPVQLATYPDLQGTLDSKPITVHHLIATIAGTSSDLFSGPENQLLQAELPQQGFALVRKGFVLTPPAKPLAPPAAPTPNPPAAQ